MALHSIRGSGLGAQRTGKRIRSYRELVQLALGKAGSVLVEIAIVVFLLGACVAYVGICGDILEVVRNVYSKRKSISLIKNIILTHFFFFS